ncbi:MAG: hypothetical protein E7Z87_08585 [Cyanobacteria bacterium SIG26]|nr:hypothetical protein [Cyanobacteria bacterium SIG26]
MVGIISLGGAQKAQAETTPTLGEKSAYTIKTGSETDYTYKTTDVDGVNSYHKIELKTPLSSSNSITWTEATSAGANTISVQLPHNDDSANPEIKYYTYSYTKPSDYTTATDRVTDISTANVDKVLFQGLSSSDSGGAIYNTADNSNVNINADFIGNYARSGGAISNYGKIGDITGGFIDNCSGAISNLGTINSITGDFISNYEQGDYVWGGAIYNGYAASIGTINGNFVNNRILSNAAYELHGGAVWNGNRGGIITTLTGNFIKNSARVVDGIDPSGGADMLAGSILQGGAVYNNATIVSLLGDFIDNDVSYSSRSWFTGFASGGAIYNDKNGVITNLAGDFIKNYVSGKMEFHSSGTEGGALFNSGEINTIRGAFIENYVLNYSDDEWFNATGGAISNKGNINLIVGNFIGNHLDSIVKPNGLGNQNGISRSGGAIFNSGEINKLEGSFINNYVTANICNTLGGAISNYGAIGSKDAEGNLIGGITNSSFINNYAKSESGTAQGGAVWTNNDLNFISDNGITEFTGNYTESAGVKDDNAIWVNSTSATLKFELKNNGKTILNDNIDGATSSSTDNEGNTVIDGYNVDITGDNTGTFYLFNDIRNADVSFANATVNTINNQVYVNNFNSLTINADTNFVADVDLEAQTMDRFTANSYGQHQGKLNVVGMNLLTDAPEDREVTEIYFAQQGLKDNVAYGGAELPHDNYQTTFYTPIYKYNAIYDNREDAGYFMFTKGDKIFVPTPDSGTNGGGSTGGGTSTPIVTPSGNPSDAFNPAVLGSSTSATVGALGTMNTTMHYAFQNAENFMHIPYLERIAHRDRNKYALSPTGDATDVGTFSPLFNKKDYGSAWVKPYATFENVALKNGPKVSNITYGTLIGFDTDIESIKRGWDRTFTGYIAYNGASQRYSGVDSYQNGGLIGGTMTLYKGNFFNATTLSVGANVASNSTMYGNDNYTMLLGGIGNKAGYNFEIKEGKLIFQPSMLVSYTWVNTFDYTNAAGVKIENDPLHAIQLAPGVKLIGNTKNGWQPYIGVNMVWNLMGKSDATANGVRLPAMSIKPYVQYGVGVQKRFKDHFMGFGQVMVHSGGRNGVSINGGFRWALGHDCNCQKVEGKGLFKFARKNKEIEAQPYDMMYRGNQQFGLYNRKVIKQLASVERTKAMK